MAGVQTTRGKKRRAMADINIVPYIDVMLVLLVIFMVTAPLMTQGIDVQLPETSANPIASTDQPLTLYIDAQGQYYLDVGSHPKQPLTDEEVRKNVSAVLRAKPKTLILVKADQNVPYSYVAIGMTLLQSAGARKIGFVTDVPNTPSGNKKNDHA